ncbi:beta-glucosidase [Acidicapsa ligni]|uniref:beta-glucosidase n=1 Tax=Acidicapsa ligni TaxID=542300 RepID=UPI0021E0F164|nr:glycoside hydrolase family 3 C-terminal domain-containing protein [Acidicapsa ligni]
MQNLRNISSQSVFRAVFCIPFVALAVFGIAVSPVPAGAQTQVPALSGPVPDSPAIEAEAHAILAKLTLDQKVELLGGVDNMYTYAEPSANLPQFKMSDGPLGVRSWGPTTAYAGGASLAASWDPELARKVGEGLGRDARARGVNFLLALGVNIVRSPVNGRDFEYLSEDPYLNAHLAVPYIQGVQSQGVSATVKHFAANNQEYDRHNVSSDVDERTLRELYFPAFEAAVKVAKVDAVMNSYNLLDGVHATQNAFLNLKVLKGEWGFQGLLMSDWDATYSAIGAANNGLDLEMPYAKFMNRKELLPAIKDGRVKEATIDDKILRMLRVALRYNWIGPNARPQTVDSLSLYSLADRAAALQGARESITLLKNENHALPIDASKVKTIALIGPDAYPAVPGGGGSSQAQAFEPVSILAGLTSLAAESGANVVYARGLPQVNDIFSKTHFEGDAQIETFANHEFSGASVKSHQAQINDLKPAMWDATDPNPRSLRYTATYKPKESGKYLLLVAASGEDSFSVKVDGKQVLDQPHREGQIPLSTTIELTAGQPIHIVADYVPHTPGVRLSLGLAPESSLISPEALRLAKMADVVVLSIGFDADTESEGYDRTFELPWGQDALIDAIVAVNPKAIVSLTAGGAVDTRRWLDKVPALLQTFYPGQEGGTAVAEVLLGKQNPEGRLAVTFDRTWQENPSYNFYYSKVEADGIPHVKYGDKLMVGYRYWTTTGKHALYPFGYGLSYTTFKFGSLSVPQTVKVGGTVDVSFDVTNTGSVAGAEVAQLYVSEPAMTGAGAKVPRPERELKGFEKVRLAPGETKHVTLSLNARDFSYWDEATKNWKMDAGKFLIHVGDSSESTPLEASITSVE